MYGAMIGKVFNLLRRVGVGVMKESVVLHFHGVPFRWKSNQLTITLDIRTCISLYMETWKNCVTQENKFQVCKVG